jgi:hypothetical protein
MKRLLISALTMLGFFGFSALGYGATTSTACVYDNYRGRWVCDSRTSYTPAEIEDFKVRQAQHEQENPTGCNTPKDNLRLCWQYFGATNNLTVNHELYDPNNRSVRTTHGFRYSYINGKLSDLSIYDRDTILKGENGYIFNEDNTVTVFDYKANNSDKFRKTYKISTDEALSRLKLPRSVLTINASTSQALSQINLPSGCSAKQKCTIKTLTTQ